MPVSEANKLVLWPSFEESYWRLSEEKRHTIFRLCHALQDMDVLRWDYEIPTRNEPLLLLLEEEETLYLMFVAQKQTGSNLPHLGTPARSCFRFEIVRCGTYQEREAGPVFDFETP